MEYPISTDELLLLQLLSEEKSARGVALRLGRDQSTVTRLLGQLSRKWPVLYKNDGAWLLSPLGRELAKFGRKMQKEQQDLLGLPNMLRIATTKEFSEWVLTPIVGDVLTLKVPSFQLQILTEAGPFEEALLEGKVDVVISCGRPVDPTVRFRRLLSFPLVCVSATPFRPRMDPETLLSTPAVEHTGLTLRSLLPGRASYPPVVCQFDHISGVRGAVRSGIGWAILPSYTVERDIRERQLYQWPLVDLANIKEEFSIWHVRGLSNLDGPIRELGRALERVRK